MLFDTPIYLVFLALVVAVYWRLNWRSQNVLLLATSYFFYGWWDWRFLLLMISSTIIDFVISRAIEDAPSRIKGRALLVASLVVNFSILGFFKYFDFFLNSTAQALDALGFHNVPRSLLTIILPPGISFYTFQEVAYLVCRLLLENKNYTYFATSTPLISILPRSVTNEYSLRS